jgi:hypothetical protein
VAESKEFEALYESMVEVKWCKYLILPVNNTLLY